MYNSWVPTNNVIITPDYTSSQWIWLNFSVILDIISYLIIILDTNFRINIINGTISVTNAYYL